MAAGGYVLFLLGDVRPEEKSRGTVMRRLGGLFLLLGAGMLLVLGRLGADLAAQINRPFFQMVSGLGFEGRFSGWKNWPPRCGFWGMRRCLGSFFCACGGLQRSCWAEKNPRSRAGESRGRPSGQYTHCLLESDHCREPASHGKPGGAGYFRSLYVPGEKAIEKSEKIEKRG